MVRMAVDPLPALATVGGIIAIGFVGYLLFERTRVTDVLLLILLGVLIGPVFGLFSVSGFQEATAFVGTLALVVIMFDGGLGLRLKDLASGFARATALAVGGIIMTVAAVAGLAHFFMGFAWPIAVMLGLILGGTSGIIVMPTIARTRATTASKTLMSVESALTDVFCVIGVVTGIGLLGASAALGAGSVSTAGKAIAASFSVAIVIGLAVGFLWLRLLRMLDGKKNAYMVTLAATLLLYAAVETVGGSGAIAVLVFGIVLGNGVDLMSRFGIDGRAFNERQKDFQGEITFLVRAFFFVYLGVILDPAVLRDPTFLLHGALIVVAIVLARILAVWLALAGDKTTRGDRGLITFMLPRGLAATVLAGMPAAAGIAGTENFLAYAFIIVAATNIVGTLAVFIHERKGRAGAGQADATTA
jgi:cell volume regulation protein A